MTTTDTGPARVRPTGAGAVLEVAPEDRATAPAAPDLDVAAAVPSTPGGRAAVLAMGLWVVVGGLLAYGVAQTVLKASALLG